MANMTFGVNILPKANADVTIGNSNNPWTIVSPSLTGTPTAPTPAEGTSTDQIATTAFVSATTGEKADKVSEATEGDFAALDSNGNLVDSGHKHSDYLTSHQDISGKADKVSNATEGNFASLDANGNLTDSGHKHSDYLTEHQDISGKIDVSEKGAANGVAELDSTGKVPAGQLPGFVDDVLEFDSMSQFPVTGESGKIYIAKDTDITYRWGGSVYVPIGSDLALGETATTAYRGDRGKAAYDHATAKGSAFQSGLYKITTNSEGHVTEASAVEKSDITALGIPGEMPDVTGKADKVANATNGNFAALDSNGNLTDSGHKHSDYLTEHQDITGKADKVDNAITGNFAGLDANGNLVDSGYNAGSFVTGNKLESTAITALFDPEIVYNEGDRCTHSGNLYQRNSWGQDTPAAEDWNEDHWTEITVLDDVMPEKADKTDTVLLTTLSRGRNENSTVGTGSFAFGDSVSASGDYSHAEGYYTIASNIYQHAGGKFNTSLGNSYQEMIGNGTSSNARSNARALDWNGNEYLNGNLYVECDANSANGTRVAKTTEVVLLTQKGVANGVAELDANGLVPSSQLPSYVDDVLEFDMADFSSLTEWVSGTSYAVGDRVKVTDTIVKGYECITANSSAEFDPTEWRELSCFPATGESGKIYVDVTKNMTYRWSGSTYVPIGGDLALGETSSTAYRGDRGKAAYDAAVVNPDSTPTENSTNLIQSGGVYTALEAKYEKPASGIPATDLADGVIPDVSGLAPKESPVFTGTISLRRKANTTAGDNSVALGRNVEASGDYSHAEGNETQATATYAHAEGNSTQASGIASHAEGASTIASSAYAHAEGFTTSATGQSTHASGAFNADMTSIPDWSANTSYNVGDIVKNGSTKYRCLVANDDSSFDSSKWTSVPFTTVQAFVVGNGKSGSKSNAMTLDWSGDLHLARDVYVNANTDGTGGTKVVKATDTMTGATSSTAGMSGLVPAPSAGDQDKYLKGDGTWGAVSTSDMTGATASTAGVHGLVPAPAAGDENKVLAGDGTWHVMPYTETLDIDLNTVTNTSGSYSGTTTDSRVTADMKVLHIELGNRNAFNDDITITCDTGTVTLTCDDVSGTSTCKITVMRTLNGLTNISGVSF